MEKKTNDDHAFVKWYVQHSKKLSSASLVQWVIVAVAVFLLVFFYDVDSYEASLLEHVIQWSATITVCGKSLPTETKNNRQLCWRGNE